MTLLMEVTLVRVSWITAPVHAGGAAVAVTPARLS